MLAFPQRAGDAFSTVCYQTLRRHPWGLVHCVGDFTFQRGFGGSFREEHLLTALLPGTFCSSSHNHSVSNTIPLADIFVMVGSMVGTGGCRVCPLAMTQPCRLSLDSASTLRFFVFFFFWTACPLYSASLMYSGFFSLPCSGYVRGQRFLKQALETIVQKQPGHRRQIKSKHFKKLLPDPLDKCKKCHPCAACRCSGRTGQMRLRRGRYRPCPGPRRQHRSASVSLSTANPSCLSTLAPRTSTATTKP